jgi:rhodanese-related sulfurtransferase
MPEEIRRDEVQRLLSEGAAVVEVLPRHEFEQEHIAGAINLPLRELRRESAESLIGSDRQRPVVLYCQGVS